MRPQLHAPTVVVTALLVASLANLAQYPSIERDAGDWYRALRVKTGHELPELGDEHFASTQARFSVYLDIREHAYGATLVVPQPVALNPEQLRGLAGAGPLEHPADEIVVSAEVAAGLDTAAVASGDDEYLGPYAVVVPPGEDADRLLVVTGPDRTYLVTPDLLRSFGGEVPS